MAPITNVEFSDVQGLLRFGYGKLTGACFLLLRIEDPAAAAGWLAEAPVSTAEVKSPPPERALQLAFTSQGLKRLGLSSEILDGFSAEFISGMAGEDNRSRRLGDTADSSPSKWQWGSSNTSLDMVAMIYATPDLFDDWKHSLASQMQNSGFTVMHCLSTEDMGNIEPFGFADGVSSPVIDWERKRNPSGDQVTYENLVMLGEFVLGYPNEYGLYTDRPKIDDAQADLPDAEDSPGSKDLGRNGTYLVMRQIDQDVHGFWKFLSKQTGNSPTFTQELAEQFVGRKMSGAPLLSQSEQTITGVGPDPDDVRLNQFTFDTDPLGVACPFGAHIRRANPRNADLPPGTPPGLFGRLSRILALDRVFGAGGESIHKDRVASARFHRLLRRGREYGPLLTQAQRTGPPQPDESPSGLHFICLNANIGRQFEFVQGAWIQSTSFDGLRDENDPIIGNRMTISACPAASFSLPVDAGLRQQIRDIPRFTTVRGGAYFFLPGIRALRYIARAGKVS